MRPEYSLDFGAACFTLLLTVTRLLGDAIARRIVHARRCNASQPRLQRVSINFVGTVHTVASAARREMHEISGHHLWLAAEVPSCLGIENQNGRAGVFSEFIRSGMVMRPQTLKSATGQFPIYCVRTSSAPLAAMQTFIFAYVDTFGDPSGPYHEAARSRTWTEAHDPFAWLGACSDFWFACCQRHHPIIDAWGHPAIVLQNVAEYPCHDRIVSIVRRSHSRAGGSSPMSATNS